MPTEDPLNLKTSFLFYIFLPLSALLSIVVFILFCAKCRKKKADVSSLPVVYSSAANENSVVVLPINSIRNGDLSPNIGLTLLSYRSEASGISNDSSVRLKSVSTLNRALPDIPTCSPVRSSTLSLPIDGRNTSNGCIKLQTPFRRSTKPRAPAPPTTSGPSTSRDAPVEPRGSNRSKKHSPSQPTHHPYARIITNNEVVDSSTENDTDDYCDPRLCKKGAVGGETGAKSKHHKHHQEEEEGETSDSISNPDVPMKRFDGQGSNSKAVSFSSASYAVAGRVPSAEIPYMTPPPPRHPSDDSNSSDSSIFDETHVKKEVSYNKISVREPLAKVLAERAVLEHHYTEVDEERLSSFYEEIAGSTNSSVTYTKIGDISANSGPGSGPGARESTPTPPLPPSVESLMVIADSSRSTSPQQSINSNQDGNQGAAAANSSNLNDLYSSVDMSSKTNKRQTTVSENLDDLYAKVQKNSVTRSSRMSSPSIVMSNSYLSSNSGNHSMYSNGDKPPPLPPTPPPPPPIPSLMNLPRSSRTISMYDSSLLSNGGLYSHQRRHSSGNASFRHDHEVGPSNLVTEEPGYEVVGTEMDIDNEPGYEEIGQRLHETRGNTRYRLLARETSRHLSDSEDAIADPGYEVVHFPEPEAEPGYEIITKHVSRHNSEVAEPGYEVIKKRPAHPPAPPPTAVHRAESDLSTEPGYERVRFPRRSQTEYEVEPAYASITRRDVKERFSERL